MPDTYLIWLKGALGRAKERMEHYRARNATDDEGGLLVEDYDDADWSEWHASTATYETLDSALRAYQSAKKRETKKCGLKSNG